MDRPKDQLYLELLRLAETKALVSFQPGQPKTLMVLLKDQFWEASQV